MGVVDDHSERLPHIYRFEAARYGRKIRQPIRYGTGVYPGRHRGCSGRETVLYVEPADHP